MTQTPDRALATPPAPAATPSNVHNGPGKLDVLVVGAGYAGAVCARELADAGYSVLVVDRRDHIAGNAHDRLDQHGVLIHDYGPHIFHTQAKRIFDYLSRFTEWREYEHRVLATVDGMLVPLPLNRRSLSMIYKRDLDSAGAAALLERVREPRETLRNSEDVVLAAVGRELCDKVYRGYTQKQWGMDLRELSPSVAARIPVRTNDDDRYFTDVYQVVPRDGYTRMFERILDHPLIRVELNVAFQRSHPPAQARHTVYTGPIDGYFDYFMGRLPYRTMRFEFEHYPDRERLQPAAAITYPSLDVPYTRTAEYKQITGQICPGTTISREFPEAGGDPYYPIPNPAAVEQYNRYRALASDIADTTFVGRLAEYRYYNMDQAVAASLKAAERVKTVLNAG